ncbi:MAG: fumarylacetoacetate hydrolase family protein [Pigmentiphaga sp.]|uniref:fumarylacetoacetate hydrolase family protein n=1 Tax=Pigmentiphaga sp. TaxID=1977564 RepID=UPI003B57F344
MKLATLDDGTRDGRLVVVSRDLRRTADASEAAPTMQACIENWQDVAPTLQSIYARLNQDPGRGRPFDPRAALAPFPRAYQWLDGSAFLNHGRLMEKAFDLKSPPGSQDVPLMYQGSADDLLGPCADIVLPREEDGIDFEGEFAVVLDDVPMGIAARDALAHVRLIMLANDVSLRALAPREMATGFGFLHAKPSSAFAPVAVTPDELGQAWRDGRVHLPVHVHWNGNGFGNPNGGEMSFSFGRLIAHAAATRRLRAGTIVGSGTVSNADRSAGSACIAERRAIEMIEHGAPRTPFMKSGDTIRLEVLDADGNPIFGRIEQTVRAAR